MILKVYLAKQAGYLISVDSASCWPLIATFATIVATFRSKAFSVIDVFTTSFSRFRCYASFSLLIFRFFHFLLRHKARGYSAEATTAEADARFSWLHTEASAFSLPAVRFSQLAADASLDSWLLILLILSLFGTLFHWPDERHIDTSFSLILSLITEGFHSFFDKLAATAG